MVEAYREQADRFMAELDGEVYLHFAGHKEELELEPIYERHADLTTLDACRQLEQAAAAGECGVELWRFACEGYIGNETRADAEELAGLEATLEATVDGETIPFRLLRMATSNEPDRARRERLEQARVELVEERMNPIHLRATERLRANAEELGAPTYRELYERFGFPLGALGEECRRLLAETEDLYVASAEKLFRARLGMGLGEATRPDFLRLLRANEWDAGFPASAMLPALTGTLADLGIDLEAQTNIELDLEQRPGKSPRAFCAPIEVPERVVLVISPMGGPDDWHALFHEAGHTEHYAHTSGDLVLEARRLGDYAVTEGWAALLERIVDEPVWLTRRLDFGRPDEFAEQAAAIHLYIARRYAAKILYELELHGDAPLDAMRARYAELLFDATKVPPSDADYLADVDSGFYASAYLRSWAFEAQVRDFLRDEFGSAWFARREAGSLLRELWSEGQRMTAEELVHELTGSELDLDSLVARVRERVGSR